MRSTRLKKRGSLFHFSGLGGKVSALYYDSLISVCIRYTSGTLLRRAYLVWERRI